MAMDTQVQYWRVLRSSEDCGKQKSIFFVVVGEPLHRSSQLLSYKNVSPVLLDLSIFSEEARNLGFYVKFPSFKCWEHFKRPHRSQIKHICWPGLACKLPVCNLYSRDLELEPNNNSNLLGNCRSLRTCGS